MKILLGTGFYTGYLPVMPATFASVLALPLIVVFHASPVAYGEALKYLGPARTRVKELVRHKVKNVLCCAGHAFD